MMANLVQSWESRDGQIYRTEEKAVAALNTRATGYVVKPLVWYGKPNEQKQRIGRCGQVAYSVSFNLDCWGYTRSGEGGHVVSDLGSTRLYQSELEAIDGADKDHERRVTASITPAPDTREAALREAVDACDAVLREAVDACDAALGALYSDGALYSERRVQAFDEEES